MRRQRGSAGTAVAIVVAILALVFLGLGLAILQNWNLATILKAGVEGPYQTDGTQSKLAPVGEMIDCSGTKVPKRYLPWVKEGANRWVGGDQAALIAVITFESAGWQEKAISNTGAVGLGQFIAATARTKQEFKGLKIITVPRADKSKVRRVTDAEKNVFRTTYPYSGRLQPGPSILASAEYLKYALAAQGGDLYKAYLKVYNNETPPNTKAADRVVAIYNSLKDGGGCKEAD